MKLSQKKTCAGCRARTWDKKCELDFPVEPLVVTYGLTLETKPTEPCYKPKTYDEFFEANDRMKEGDG